MQVPICTPAELRGWLEEGRQIQLVDVREREEFAAGHIQGARLIPMGEIPWRYGEIDPSKEAVLICRSGQRSHHVALYLMQLGYTRVYNLDGGMLAWEREAP